MNSQIITKLIQQVMLGRWCLTYVDKTIERANEDHCGTCVNHPKEEEEVPVKHS